MFWGYTEWCSGLTPGLCTHKSLLVGSEDLMFGDHTQLCYEITPTLHLQITSSRLRHHLGDRN